MTSPSVSFDRMTIQDVDPAVLIDEATQAALWTPQMFLSEIAAGRRSFCFVARLEGRVVGYLIFRMILDELHFMNVAVHPAWQRRGLGRALIHFALSVGRREGMKSATLEVRAGNLQAQRLYQKLGFRKVGTRKGYYAVPKEDAFLLTYNGDWGEG